MAKTTLFITLVGKLIDAYLKKWEAGSVNTDNALTTSVMNGIGTFFERTLGNDLSLKRDLTLAQNKRSELVPLLAEINKLTVRFTPDKDKQWLIYTSHHDCENARKKVENNPYESLKNDCAIKNYLKNFIDSTQTETLKLANQAKKGRGTLELALMTTKSLIDECYNRLEKLKLIEVEFEIEDPKTLKIKTDRIPQNQALRILQWNMGLFIHGHLQKEFNITPDSTYKSDLAQAKEQLVRLTLEHITAYLKEITNHKLVPQLISDKINLLLKDNKDATSQFGIHVNVPLTPSFFPGLSMPLDAIGVTEGDLRVKLEKTLTEIEELIAQQSKQERPAMRMNQ